MSVEAPFTWLDDVRPVLASTATDRPHRAGAKMHRLPADMPLGKPPPQPADEAQAKGTRLSMLASQQPPTLVRLFLT
jgi:hypothetical protein